jgi:nitrate/nitrite transporter NarK
LLSKPHEYWRWLDHTATYSEFKKEMWAEALLWWETAVGFTLYFNNGVVFGLPVSAISKEITGRAMGIVNTAGQCAGFLSPLIVGYLVQISGGGARSFDTAFMFLIGAILISSLVGMTFPKSKAELVTAAGVRG